MMHGGFKKATHDSALAIALRENFSPVEREELSKKVWTSLMKNSKQVLKNGLVLKVFWIRDFCKERMLQKRWVDLLWVVLILQLSNSPNI